MDQPDRQWLAEYRSGNVDALGKLVELYRRPLFSFILKMMEGHRDAEEVFQEVWFRAIKSLPTYRDDKFLSWLFRIAHNLVIDRVRRARPMVDIQGGSDDGDDAIQTQLADTKLLPDGTVAGKDLGQKITGAVGRLPDEQRAVFLMRTEGDLSFKEIARIQGISINTALARMQYALNKLRNELQLDYEALSRG